MIWICKVKLAEKNFQLLGDPEGLVRKGNIVVGRVLKKINHVGLFIQLPNMNAGIAHLTELNDIYTENPLDEFELDQFVR